MDEHEITEDDARVISKFGLPVLGPADGCHTFEILEDLPQHYVCLNCFLVQRVDGKCHWP